MIQSWENLVTDGRTDGQTDESDFIGRCPINVERPTFVIQWNYKTLIGSVKTNQKQPKFYLITNSFIMNDSCSFFLVSIVKT